MFNTNKDYQAMGSKELLIEVLSELDEIKRYVANIHVNTDSEVKEMLDMMKRMERQISETDKQIDRMERYEKTLNNIDSTVRRLEKKN